MGFLVVVFKVEWTSNSGCEAQEASWNLETVIHELFFTPSYSFRNNVFFSVRFTHSCVLSIRCSIPATNQSLRARGRGNGNKRHWEIAGKLCARTCWTGEERCAGMTRNLAGEAGNVEKTGWIVLCACQESVVYPHDLSCLPESAVWSKPIGNFLLGSSNLNDLTWQRRLAGCFCVVGTVSPPVQGCSGCILESLASSLVQWKEVRACGPSLIEVSDLHIGPLPPCAGAVWCTEHFSFLPFLVAFFKAAFQVPPAFYLSLHLAVISWSRARCSFCRI